MKHGYENHGRGRRGGKPFHGRGGPRGRFGGEEGRGLFGGRGGLGRDDHRGGGRRGKRFLGEELRLMVLGLIENAPMHGYQLIRAFAEKSGEAYSPSPGVLYPMLTLLADMGLVEEAPGEGRSRSFVATEAGKAELEARRAECNAAFQRLEAMGEEGARTNAAPIRRAMMNLRTASMQRMSAEGADNETAFAIAALLDEAAQKIERL